MEKQFDALGADGWELCWILMNQALQGEKDGHVVISSGRCRTKPPPAHSQCSFCSAWAIAHSSAGGGVQPLLQRRAQLPARSTRAERVTRINVVVVGRGPRR